MIESVNKAVIGAQNTALTNIYKIMRFLCSPKDIAIKVPPTGENRIGVKKEIPSKPHLLQTLTILLVLFENTFLSLNIVFFRNP